MQPGTDSQGQTDLLKRAVIMIVLGVVLLLLGWLLAIKLLWILGIIVVIVGVVLFCAGSLGHNVGGRRNWW